VRSIPIFRLNTVSKRLGVFGSHTRDRPSEASDIGLVVEFERPVGFKFVELSEHLERIQGKKVDLLTRAGIQAIRVAGVAQEIEESIVYV